MSTPFADLEAIAGGATVRLLANASLRIGAGGQLVDCVFARHQVDAQLGGAGMKSHSAHATLITEDLGVTVVEEGASVLIGTTDYVVVERTDDAALGQTVLELKSA